jgi:hypothetical protein
MEFRTEHEDRVLIHDGDHRRERLVQWPRRLVLREIIPEFRVKVTKVVRHPGDDGPGIVEAEHYSGPIPATAPNTSEEDTSEDPE